MLINWSNCKRMILEVAKQTRSHPFTRVSGDVRDHMEGVMRGEIARLVHSHPSMGKTIAMGKKSRKGGSREEG